MQTQTNTGLVKKLFRIQTEISAVKKSSTNTHFRSKYSDLNEVLDTVKEQLNKNKILLTQPTGKDEHGPYVETELFDTEGAEKMTTRVYLSGTEDNMQKIGAAITYGRRYGIVSLLALESEDDDGETAVGRGREEVKPQTNKTSTPVQTSVYKKSKREDINNQISKTAEALIAEEKVTFESLVETLEKEYKVKTKEELTDEQAKKFLSDLRGRLG